ncbi:MAG: GspE/PulE family protein [Patescibacteria group bacterium]
MSSEELLKEIQKSGLADETTVSKLRRESVLSGQSIEAVVSRTRLIGDQALAELKSGLLKVPFKKIDAESYDADLLSIVPEETARNYGVIPLSKKDNLLVVGMISPDDPKAQEALKFIARKNRLNLGVYLISYGDWMEILKRYSSYRTELERAVEALGIRQGEGGRKTVLLEEGGSGEDAPIVKIVANTLREAVSARASDVHIEPQTNSLRIRFRIDGDLHEVASLPAELAQPVVSRIKVMSSLKLDETRVPQDGRFRSKIFDREIDFRISTFPTPLGEKAAVRILDPTTGLKSFDDLELLPPVKKKIERGLDRPFGMVMITGPTGSGKTTTLYAMLQNLNDEDVNIVSLEDPVEYFVSGINQSQVKPEIGYDFANGLRQILRQDPDIIMVGEIRDNETAALAVHAALTGHIVLSTLHTNNSLGVIPRLIDMKVEPFLLPASLSLMLAQRLVGRLCDACKSAEEAPAAVQKAVKRALEGVPAEISSQYEEPYKIYHSKGCNVCKGKGVVGRLAIFEVLEMTPEMEEIINTGPTIQRILKEAKNQNMISLRQDGIIKALEGKTSIEDVIKETEEL